MKKYRIKKKGERYIVQRKYLFFYVHCVQHLNNYAVKAEFYSLSKAKEFIENSIKPKKKEKTIYIDPYKNQRRK